MDFFTGARKILTCNLCQEVITVIQSLTVRKVFDNKRLVYATPKHSQFLFRKEEGSVESISLSGGRLETFLDAACNMCITDTIDVIYRNTMS